MGNFLAMIVHCCEFFDVDLIRSWIFDFHLDHWGLSWKCGILHSLMALREGLTGRSKVAVGYDNAPFDLTIYGSKLWTKGMEKPHPRTFYRFYCTSNTSSVYGDEANAKGLASGNHNSNNSHTSARAPLDHDADAGKDEDRAEAIDIEDRDGPHFPRGSASLFTSGPTSNATFRHRSNFSWNLPLVYLGNRIGDYYIDHPNARLPGVKDEDWLENDGTCSLHSQFHPHDCNPKRCSHHIVSLKGSTASIIPLEKGKYQTIFLSEPFTHTGIVPFPKDKGVQKAFFTNLLDWIDNIDEAIPLSSCSSSTSSSSPAAVASPLSIAPSSAVDMVGHVAKHAGPTCWK